MIIKNGKCSTCLRTGGTKQTQTEKANHMSKSSLLVLLHHVFHVCCNIMHYHYEFKIMIQFSCNFSLKC